MKVLVGVLVVAACGPAAKSVGDDLPSVDANEGGGGGGGGGDGGGGGSGTGAVAPGGSCSCDADCADEGAAQGACIYGVCMTKASGACASGGSQSECPTGSRCWTLDGSDVGPLCWPDCDAHTCAGQCDSDGSCVPMANGNCDASCGAACDCTDNAQCGAGNRCVQGDCVPEMEPAPGAPGPGPGPACSNLPPRDCAGASCGQLVTFNPRTNTAWDDYALNGETAANQYRSYLRKDLMQLVSYATSFVACKAAGWGGNGGALGLGDMSEANGAIPGTSINSPGHPPGTHVNGFDIDLAYYQTNTTNNRLRPICPYTQGGQDMSHCVGAPTTLDVWRHALFLGAVFESPRTRVVGVDGQAGPMILSALDTLCDTGWLSQTACNNAVLAYETTNGGAGWYYHHHHHSHISLKNAAFIGADDACLGACGSTHKPLPGRSLTLHRVRAPE